MRPESAQRGQALVEFALFSSAALLAVAFLIRIAMIANYQQEIEQETFRWAQREATNLDRRNNRPPQSITYVHYRDRQLADPSQAFALMPRVSTQASSTVSWGKYFTFLGGDSSGCGDAESPTLARPGVVIHLNNRRSRPIASECVGYVARAQKTLTASASQQQNSGGSNLQSGQTESSTLTFSKGRSFSSSVSGGASWSGSGW